MTRNIARAAALCLGAALLISGPAAADQVFNDDVIMPFGVCIGAACVDGETFNFDTMLLKQQSIRFDFIDTDTGNFPTRDWRIETNSVVSGGPSYFALKDMGDTSTRLEGGTPILYLSAGARANSIFVNSAGRIGFGTATPARDLHVVSGFQPALRLEQDGSGGENPQVWELGGGDSSLFIHDATNGQLPLRILPNAGGNRLVLRNTGVGIGTLNPTANLEIVGGTGFKTGTGGAIVEFLARGDLGFGLVGTDTNHPLHLRTNNIARMVLATNGNVGIGTTTPAARLHTTGTVRFAGVANCASGIRSNAAGDLSCVASSAHLKNIAGALSPDVALANVMALRPQVGAYKDTPEEPEHWLIAEEVAEVDPALVGLKDGEPFTVKTYGVIADLVAVIQEQQREIAAQRTQFEARIEAQQSEIEGQRAQFEARIAALEQQANVHQ
jgi:hypothetical protein